MQVHIRTFNLDVQDSDASQTYRYDDLLFRRTQGIREQHQNHVCERFYSRFQERLKTGNSGFSSNA